MRIYISKSFQINHLHANELIWDSEQTKYLPRTRLSYWKYSKSQIQPIIECSVIVLSDLVQAYMECNCSKQWTNFVKSNPSYKFWTSSQHSCRYIGLYLFVIKVEIQCKKLHACIYWACFSADCLNLISPYFHFVKYWSESNIINIDSDFHF